MEMKMEEILARLVKLLSESRDSAYATESVESLYEIAKVELDILRSTGKLLHPERISDFFLPTASLQEISLDNGWGEEYLELARGFDAALKASL
jgi:hypothetical protein